MPLFAVFSPSTPRRWQQGRKTVELEDHQMAGRAKTGYRSADTIGDDNRLAKRNVLGKASAMRMDRMGRLNHPRQSFPSRRTMSSTRACGSRSTGFTSNLDRIALCMLPQAKQISHRTDHSGSTFEIATTELSERQGDMEVWFTPGGARQRHQEAYQEYCVDFQ